MLPPLPARPRAAWPASDCWTCRTSPSRPPPCPSRLCSGTAPARPAAEPGFTRTVIAACPTHAGSRARSRRRASAARPGRRGGCTTPIAAIGFRRRHRRASLARARHRDSLARAHRRDSLAAPSSRQPAAPIVAPRRPRPSSRTASPTPAVAAGLARARHRGSLARACHRVSLGAAPISSRHAARAHRRQPRPAPVIASASPAPMRPRQPRRRPSSSQPRPRPAVATAPPAPIVEPASSRARRRESLARTHRRASLARACHRRQPRPPPSCASLARACHRVSLARAHRRASLARACHPRQPRRTPPPPRRHGAGTGARAAPALPPAARPSRSPRPQFLATRPQPRQLAVLCPSPHQRLGTPSAPARPAPRALGLHVRSRGRRQRGRGPSDTGQLSPHACPDLAAGRTPIILRLDRDNAPPVFRLRLGGFANREEAERFCTRLAERQLPCWISG